ncbi:hypothetical protein [Stappia sp. ICDLI1TA098]
MIKQLAIFALIAAALAASQTARAGDFTDRQMLIDRLNRDEARGGPYIRGGRSAFQARVKVCNVMPTPVRDPKTGKLVKVMKEVCWME